MDSKRLIFILKLGFFPVTDDFWCAAGMPLFVGENFDWAFRTPLSMQKFMPYRSEYLENKTYDEIKEAARKNLLCPY